MEYDPESQTYVPAPSSFADAMRQNAIRLSYQDGKITDVCLTSPEPVWVTNVKRGIASLIQNNMEDFSRDRNVTEVT